MVMVKKKNKKCKTFTEGQTVERRAFKIEKIQKIIKKALLCIEKPDILHFSG